MTQKTDGQIASMDTKIALPRENGELVFSSTLGSAGFRASPLHSTKKTSTNGGRSVPNWLRKSRQQNKTTTHRATMPDGSLPLKNCSLIEA